MRDLDLFCSAVRLDVAYASTVADSSAAAVSVTVTLAEAAGTSTVASPAAVTVVTDASAALPS